MRSTRNARTDRRNLLGSRSDRLPGFEKSGVRSTVSVNPPSIAAGTMGSVDVTIAGVRPVRHHLVIALAPVTLEAGLVALSSEIVAPDTVRVLIRNDSGNTINGAARNWIAVVFRRRAT